MIKVFCYALGWNEVVFPHELEVVPRVGEMVEGYHPKKDEDIQLYVKNIIHCGPPRQHFLVKIELGAKNE